MQHQTDVEGDEFLLSTKHERVTYFSLLTNQEIKKKAQLSCLKSE